MQTHTVLAVNSGSSTLRFALYRHGVDLQPSVCGTVDRIGLPDTCLRLSGPLADQHHSQRVAASNPAQAASVLIDCLQSRELLDALSAIGHRVVHGMHRTAPELVTPALLADLRQLRAVDPAHIPGEIALIEAFSKRLPAVPQVACFDTAFHTSMPRVARMLALPRWLDAKGVQRYGFHGLSYAYLIEELERTGGCVAAQGRVILAHLGNGASLAAVREGKCIDTSMGFTPAAGLPMGTRAGDLDPGLAAYLQRTENISPTKFDRMVHQECGLLGISETTSDMRDLLAMETTDVRAAEAVNFFCYQIRKWIGAYAAVLGGLDTLVFAGGIGENAAVVRARVCDRLGFLGVALGCAVGLPRCRADAVVTHGRRESNPGRPKCKRRCACRASTSMAHRLARAYPHGGTSRRP